MRISQETVQRIIQAADVVDVIGDFVSLKKRGANMIACCPFHNEKSPSFYVSPVKQIYKCFGCGKAGDSVRFIMEIEGLGYPEALRHLAKKYSIEIEEKEYSNEEIQTQNEKESLYIILDYARKFYEEQLWQSDIGQAVGLSYFKERGFNHATIQQFNLGYSPDAWDVFTKKALKDGYSLDILEKAGLSIIKEGKDPIDRFRGRMIFPIHNLAGKPIAFGARIIKKDPNAPKYLNSPETAVYHKSHIVYGISHAKTAIRNEDNCFMVEGYTDVVSMHQAGISNAVASSGTSLTKEQIQLIRRFTPNITVLYDGDSAGIKASLRGIDLILEEGMNVKSVVFPDGDDPDSYVQKVGATAFKEYIKTSAKDFITFKTEIMLGDVGDDPIKRANVISELVETIAKVPDAIKRSVFTQQVARLLAIDEDVLVREGNKRQIKKAEDKQKEAQRQQQRSINVGGENFPVQEEGGFEPLPIVLPVNRSRLSHQEEEICRLLVCYGNVIIERNAEGHEFTLTEYILTETKNIDSFESPVYQQILGIFREYYEKDEIPDTLYFTGHKEPEIQSMTINWLATPHQISENWAKYEINVPEEVERLSEHAYIVVLRLKKEIYQKKVDDFQTQELTDEVLISIMQYKTALQKIAGALGTIVQ
jgi:DNA primase